MDLETCENCQIGRYRPARLPYLSWINQNILVLPNAPGHVCDMCGDSFYDSDFLQQLDRLVQGEGEADPGRAAPNWHSRRSWQQT